MTPVKHLRVYLESLSGGCLWYTTFKLLGILEPAGEWEQKGFTVSEAILRNLQMVSGFAYSPDVFKQAAYEMAKLEPYRSDLLRRAEQAETCYHQALENKEYAARLRAYAGERLEVSKIKTGDKPVQGSLF